MQRSFLNILSLFALAGILCACGSEQQGQAKEQEQTVATPDSGGSVSKEDPAALNTLQKPYKVGLGDLDKDGVKDTILVSAPATRPDDDMMCVDSSCTTYFAFTENSFPAFTHVMALGGVVGNAGDLDDDGICEIYFVPDWFTSSWTGLNIYSLKSGSWKKIASQDIRREDGIMEDSLYMAYDKRIIKHSKDYFELVGNVMDDEGIEKLVPKKYYFK